MDAQDTVEILNELLGLEQRSITLRLVESTLFVPRSAVDGMNMVRRLADVVEQNCEKLAELIIELGGVPVYRTSDVTSADLHYQQLRHVMPRLLANEEQLVQAYTTASEHLDTQPRASALVTRILSQHRENLHALRPGAADRPNAA